MDIGKMKVRPLGRPETIELVRNLTAGMRPQVAAMRPLGCRETSQLLTGIERVVYGERFTVSFSPEGRSFITSSLPIFFSHLDAEERFHCCGESDKIDQWFVRIPHSHYHKLVGAAPTSPFGRPVVGDLPCIMPNTVVRRLVIEEVI